jgi:hypothetical protein
MSSQASEFNLDRAKSALSAENLSALRKEVEAARVEQAGAVLLGHAYATNWRKLERLMADLAAKGDRREVSLMLKAGFGTAVTDMRWEQTPLGCALQRGQIGCLVLLLEAGASMDFGGWHHSAFDTNALHEAVRLKNLRAVRCLLSRGASPFAKRARETPREFLDRVKWRDVDAIYAALVTAENTHNGIAAPAASRNAKP